jgi:hypothetical protein
MRLFYFLFFIADSGQSQQKEIAVLKKSEKIYQSKLASLQSRLEKAEKAHQAQIAHLQSQLKSSVSNLQCAVRVVFVSLFRLLFNMLFLFADVIPVSSFL